MKKSLLVFTALTFSFIPGVTVQAQQDDANLPPSGLGTHNNQGGPAGSDGDDAQRAAHREKMLQMFDTNHDGTLDDNERAQMREAMRKHRMQQQNSEAGGAGSGSATQGQGFGQRGGEGGFDNPQRQQFRQKMLEKFDTNHDGKLDDAERAQMHEFMQRRRQQREQGEGGGFSGPPLDGAREGGAFGGPAPGGLRPSGGVPGGGASGGDGLPPVGPPLGPASGNSDPNN